MSGASAPDIVLRGGVVIDGTGAPGRRADVRLNSGFVDEVLEPGADAAGVSIDVTGRVVAPGFIDLHTHADFSLPTHPGAPSMVRQGVTTLVVGNCGFSPFPVVDGERKEMLRQATAVFGRGLEWDWTELADYRACLEKRGPSVNVGFLVGHSALRIATMGFDDRPPTPDELKEMKQLLERSLEQGALGMSTGLIYAPGGYAQSDELVALCAVVARYGGFYATHMRNEGEQLLDAVRETLDVARRAGVPLQMSHHKVLGQRNWGLTAESLALVDTALRDGMDLSLDQYPYPASSTTMMALIPGWATDGGSAAMRERLDDPAWRARLRAEILDGPTDGRPKRDFEPDTVMVSSVSDPRLDLLVGRTLSEFASERHQEPVDAMLDLLAADSSVEVVIFAIGEDDIERVLRHPVVAVASDGWTLDPSTGGRPHPRSYGTFVRVLEKYVREREVVSLPEAIRKMTSLPADRLRMSDRGRIAPGMRADLVVFDPDTVRENATFLAPHSFATGVDHVFINGAHTIKDSLPTDERGGHMLARTGTA